MKSQTSRWLAAVFLLVAVDQLAKWISFFQLQPGQVIPVIPSLVAITIKQNPGFVYQFGADIPGIRVLTVTTSFVAIALVLWVCRTKLQAYRWHAWAVVFLVFALSGALGNLVDRFFLGYVRDFLWLRWFGTINLSDVYISTSAVSAALILAGGRRSLSKIP